MNLLSLSETKISGAPNTANQFEITAPRAISAVCSSRFLAHRKSLPKTRKRILDAQKGRATPIVGKIHFNQFIESIGYRYFSYPSKYPFLFKLVFLIISRQSLNFPKQFPRRLCRDKMVLRSFPGRDMVVSKNESSSTF